MELVKTLLKVEADVNALPYVFDGRTQIQAAASTGNWEPIRILIDADADINAPAAEELGSNCTLSRCRRVEFCDC